MEREYRIRRRDGVNANSNNTPIKIVSKLLD